VNMKASILVAVLFGVLAEGCTQDRVGEGGATPSMRDPRPVIRVKNDDEFLRAIGSDRIIILAPGTFRFPCAPRRNITEHVSLDLGNRAPACDIILHDIHNMKIIGSGPGKSRILQSDPYLWVFCMRKVSNVELANLEMGHPPELKGYCSGGVLSVEWATDVTIRDCVLYGCGTVGLRIENVKRFSFSNSTIRECTYSLIEGLRCKKVKFSDSAFLESGKFDLIEFDECADVSFENCRFEGNFTTDGRDGYSLFKGESGGPIRLSGCILRGNRAGWLSNPVGCMVHEETRFEGNEFR